MIMSEIFLGVFWVYGLMKTSTMDELTLAARLTTKFSREMRISFVQASKLGHLCEWVQSSKMTYWWRHWQLVFKKLNQVHIL